MCRIPCLVAVAGLLMVGCADTSTPTAQNSSGEPQTVTANKPLAGEEVLEGQTIPAAELSEEVPAPDESLLPPADSSEEDAAAQAHRELSEAGDAVADWAAETKDKLVALAEVRLAELDEKMAQLEVKTAELTGDAKARWEENQKRLEQRRSEFSEELEQLKSSGDAAWKDMAKGIAEAWTKLKEASEAAASEFE